MKHSPDSQEPKKWASGLSEPDAATGPDTFTGDDAEVQANEERLLAALGKPVAPADSSPDQGREKAQFEARAEFRDRLRAQFVGSGSSAAAGSAPTAQPVDGRDTAIEKLRSWSPAAAPAEFESRLRGEFLSVDAAVAPQHEASQHQASPSSVVRREPRARRTASSGRGAQAKRSPFRLVAAGGLLAAAAALLLYFQRPADVDTPGQGADEQVAQVDRPAVGPDMDPARGAAPAPEVGLPTTPAEPGSAWELDADLTDAASILASVRIDGQRVESMEEFQRQMATAERIESVGADLRVRHRDEFVMELAADSAVRLDRWAPEVTDGEPRVLFAESGSLRVATGPGFDSLASLVVETPHIRTEVVGTIFGLDIGQGYTCVCCLEGTVRTEPLDGMFDDELVEEGEFVNKNVVNAGRTWVAHVAEPTPLRMPLVDDHRAPLDRLANYWA